MEFRTLHILFFITFLNSCGDGRIESEIPLDDNPDLIRSADQSGDAPAGQDGHQEIHIKSKSKITFDFAAPNISSLQKSSLWATYYNLPVYNNGGAYPLKSPTGVNLGPTLSQRQWCNAAMEGSVVVISAGVPTTYNYASTSSTNQVDCTVYYPKYSATGRVRFKVANGPFGDGVNGYKLVPFRTIAVDKSLIPIGTILYIPAARGVSVVLPDGSVAKHDGYFLAGDVGGAIIGDHIDVFIATNTKSPFSFIKSSPTSKFEAYKVTDTKIIESLKLIHKSI